MRKNLLTVQNKLAKIANILDEKGLCYTANRLDEINEDLFKQATMKKEAQSPLIVEAIAALLEAFRKRANATEKELEKIVNDLIYGVKNGEENEISKFLREHGIELGNFTDILKMMGITVVSDPTLYEDLGNKGPIVGRENPDYLGKGTRRKVIDNNPNDRSENP